MFAWHWLERIPGTESSLRKQGSFDETYGEQLVDFLRSRDAARKEQADAEDDLVQAYKRKMQDELASCRDEGDSPMRARELSEEHKEAMEALRKDYDDEFWVERLAKMFGLREEGCLLYTSPSPRDRG